MCCRKYSYTLGTMLTTRHDRKKKPKTVKDFFNTKKFPGKRAIYKGAMSNIEFALVGALKSKPGKGNGKVWDALEKEGGVDKAIAAIKALCEDPNGGCVFWNAGAQPPELLANGEVVMATGWNGRFFNAQMEGTPFTKYGMHKFLTMSILH